MIILGYRRDIIARHTGRRSQIGASRALEYSPSVIASERDGVDLFYHSLPDVTCEKRSGAAVERAPEGVAQPRRIDFIASRSGPEEWIARRRSVWRAAARVHIDAQHLAQQLFDVLRAIAGVVRASAVAHPYLEESIGAEIYPPAVMIGE